MNAKQAKNELEKEYSKYQDKIESLALKSFNEIIKPYLIKHNYYFLSGNGTCYIGFDNPNTGYANQVDIENLPAYIQDLLNLEVPGFRAGSFGDFMPNFQP